MELGSDIHIDFSALILHFKVPCKEVKKMSDDSS